MFHKKTVIVLGAGASRHYGYPTGGQLAKDMVAAADRILQDHCRADLRHPRIKKILAEQEIPGFLDTIQHTKDKIVRANPVVIDDFLGANPCIQNSARFLIAFVLFDAEAKKHSPIPGTIVNGKAVPNDGRTSEDDWVRFLAHHLTSGCDSPEALNKNDITFVTFNYDMSLERRLYDILKNYQYFDERNQIERFFTPQRFLHVYGQLYDFAPNHHCHGTPASADTFSDIFARAHHAAYATEPNGGGRRTIRIISPDEKNLPNAIPNAIAGAEYLYFLGYGFDPRNNALLKLGSAIDTCPQQQVVRFTNMGNANRINTRVAETFHIPPAHLVQTAFRATSKRHPKTRQFVCEKSTKSVYGALADDFDWPF